MQTLARIGGAAAVIVLGGSLLAASVLATDHAVSIKGFAFSPGTISIAVGDAVTWTNNDGTSHTATGDGGAFDTGTLAAGATKTVVFATAGTFSYHCAIHKSMTATVVVNAAPAAPASTDTLAATVASDDGSPITIILAVLGLSMLLGTMVIDRRLARRS